MKMHHLFTLLLAATLAAAAAATAQEFPVAVGSDTTWSAGAVYGGQNGIVAVQGSPTSPYTINAQIIGTPGQLSGDRFFLNGFGLPPGAIPIFDGTHYLLVWLDFSGDLKGQFVSTTGELLWAPLTIASGVSLSRMISYNLAVGNGSILVGYIKSNGYLYGQLVTTSGALSGNAFPISTGLARDFSMEYDGTNYLVAWVDVIPDTDKDVLGQLVSGSGALVGSNFLINGGPNYSDNPTWMAFDGTRYLVVYHESVPGTSVWSIQGSFVTKAGAVEESLTLVDTTKSPTNPTIAFDGKNYLLTWTQKTDLTLMGCFLTTSGAQAGSPFVVFPAVENKLPMGGLGYGGGKYLAVVTRVDFTMTNGDVSARFIDPLTGIESPANTLPVSTGLLPNYPNPFNPTTTIVYRVGNTSVKGPASGEVRLAVYDLLGREAAVLVDGERSPGEHSITWNAAGLPSGVYVCRLQTSGGNFSQKLMLMR
jgi:hypothetical protein